MSFFLSIAVVLLLLGDSQPLFPQAPVFSPPGIHDPEGAAAQPWIGPPRAAGPGEEGGKHAGSNRVSAAPQCACLLICYLGEVSRFGQVDFVPSSAPQGVSTPAAPDSQPALSPGVGAEIRSTNLSTRGFFSWANVVKASPASKTSNEKHFLITCRPCSS